MTNRPGPLVDATAEQLASLSADARLFGGAAFAHTGDVFMPEAGTRPTARTYAALDELLFKSLVGRGEDFGIPGPSWVRLVLFPENSEQALAAAGAWPLTERTGGHKDGR